MIVGIIVVIIAAILIIAAVVAARRGSGRGSAQAELSRLPLRPLSASEREYYLDDWVHVQGSFVDAPGTALESADTLVGQLLQNVGYPTDDEHRLLRLLSVRHGGNVEAYREARAVHEKRKAGAAEVDTETMRIALNGYDDLFQDVMATHKGQADTEHSTADTGIPTAGTDTPVDDTGTPTDETSKRRHEAEAAS